MRTGRRQSSAVVSALLLEPDCLNPTCHLRQAAELLWVTISLCEKRGLLSPLFYIIKIILCILYVTIIVPIINEYCCS